MASSSRTEATPLLGGSKRKLSPQPRQKRYASSSSSQYLYRAPQQTLDGEEIQSFISIAIDGTPTYGALIGSHVLALLPGLALQLATILVVFHAPCHIDYDSDDRRSDRKICRQLLSEWMSMTAFTLGLVSWLAAYSFRPAISRAVDLILDSTQKIWSTWKSEEEDVSNVEMLSSGRSAGGTVATLITMTLQTIALECLRMFGVIVANAVLFANLARLEKRGKIGVHPAPQDSSHWVLQWHDPRLTIGLWVAIGWCMTEFVVSAYQMLNRLTLYKPFYEVAEVEMEQEVTEERVLADSYTPPRSSMTGSQSPGAYLSDSAATVRAPTRVQESHPNGNGTGIGADSEDDKTGGKSPRERLLETRRQAASGGGPDARLNGESGYSIMRLREEAANEEELNALRNQLDEEVDSLLATRMREELHQTLGQPLTEVPIVLCALWRVDGWIWNLTATLLMSASVTLAQGPLFEAVTRLVPPFQLIKTTLFILIALHAIFSSMWALLMPTFGFAFVTYTSLLAGLGLFITALARWGLLI